MKQVARAQALGLDPHGPTFQTAMALDLVAEMVEQMPFCCSEQAGRTRNTNNSERCARQSRNGRNADVCEKKDPQHAAAHLSCEKNGSEEEKERRGLAKDTWLRHEVDTTTIRRAKR